MRLIVLLALSGDGSPANDHNHAAALAVLGAPVLAARPTAPGAVLAAALEGRDAGARAKGEGLPVA